MLFVVRGPAKAGRALSSDIWRVCCAPQPPPVGQRLTSVNNRYVKHCVKLRTSQQYRRKAGRVLLVGSTIIEEVKGVLASIGSDIHAAFTLPGTASDNNFHGLGNCRRIEVDQHVLKKISGLESVDTLSIVTEIDLPWKGASFMNQQINRLLALEGIQDPGNLGTLIRTAVAFGWDGVFLLPGCCDPFNDKALRASRGGVFKAPVISGSWAEFRELVDVKNLECFAGEPGVDDQDSLPPMFEEPLCLVLGSEGQGLSSTTLTLAKPITIPMSGDMESLNVAVAGGILMFLMGGTVRK